jgi:hypothetical protein
MQIPNLRLWAAYCDPSVYAPHSLAHRRRWLANFSLLDHLVGALLQEPGQVEAQLLCSRSGLCTRIILPAYAYAPAPVYYGYYAPAPVGYNAYNAPRPYLWGCWRWRFGYRYRVC